MLPGNLESTVEQLLEEHFGGQFRLMNVSTVGGGCIHHATRLETNRGDYFLKYNQPKEVENFRAEARGLKLLAEAEELPVPEVIAVGDNGERSYILMEFLAAAPRAKDFWQAFGQGLAALHRYTQAEFGLDHHNYIGRLRQRNQPHRDWIDFFVQERLEFQLELAETSGVAPKDLRPALERLYPRLRDLIPYEPPSLLHGDLWSGNFLVGPQGQACIVDPAIYYGHREAEIAFTRLFGGYSPTFYQAYHEAWPLQSGWENRVPLMNLYPLMVHLNLFGRGYLPDIQAILTKFA